MNYLIEQGDLSEEDVAKAKPFFDNGLPSANMFSMAKMGHLGDVSEDPSFQAFKKVLKWLGLDNVKFDRTTAQPHEEQFWDQFDNIFDLKEKDMLKHLELFVTDPKDQAKLQAFEEGKYSFTDEETTKQIA